MSGPVESTSINIIRNLSILEALANEEHIADSRLEEVYELLLETSEWTYETIISEEIEIALQMLDLLFYLDRVNSSSRRKSASRRDTGIPGCRS